MDPIVQELKTAREAKRLSLSDIADATLINIKHLEQIELGNMSILPQTYIRAFIREYAAVVGLDPVAVMKRYDDRNAGTEDHSHRTPSVADKAHSNGTLVSSKSLRWIFAAVAFFGVVIILWASMSKETPPTVQETPFQNVVKENERRLAPAPIPEKRIDVPQIPLPPGDSLTLHAAVTDTLWLRIVIDQAPPREYIFRPRTSVSWRARDRFVVTLGNAGAAQFTLNKKEIGMVGKNGIVVRDLLLSRETLKQSELPH